MLGKMMCVVVLDETKAGVNIVCKLFVEQPNQSFGTSIKNRFSCFTKTSSIFFSEDHVHYENSGLFGFVN